MTVHLGLDEVLCPWVNGEHCHVEARVQESRQEATLVRRRATDEERQSLRAQLLQLALALGQEVKAPCVHLLEKAPGAVILRVEHQRGLGAVARDDHVDPVAQILAQHLHLLIAERRAHPSDRQLPLAKRAVLDLVPLAGLGRHLRRHARREPEPSPIFLRGLPVDQALEHGPQFVNLHLQTPEVHEGPAARKGGRHPPVVDGRGREDQVLQGCAKVQAAVLERPILRQPANVGDDGGDHRVKTRPRRGQLDRNRAHQASVRQTRASEFAVLAQRDDRHRAWGSSHQCGCSTVV